MMHCASSQSLCLALKHANDENEEVIYHRLWFEMYCIALNLKWKRERSLQKVSPFIHLHAIFKRLYMAMMIARTKLAFEYDDDADDAYLLTDSFSKKKFFESVIIMHLCIKALTKVNP